MDPKEVLRQNFELISVNVEDDAILLKCLDLCDIYNVSAADFVEQWLAFILTHGMELKITSKNVARMENEVLKKKNKAVQDSTPSVEQSSVAEEWNSGGNNDELECDAILGMYGFKGSASTNVKRARSPHGLDASVKKQNKIRALDRGLSPTSCPDTPETPRRSVHTQQKGRVLEKFGDDVEVWKSANPSEVLVDKTNDPHVPAQATYMFQLLSKRAAKTQRICRKFGAQLCSAWYKLSLKDDSTQITSDVRNQSQTDFRTWGRIRCEMDGRLNASAVVLEGCKNPRHVDLPSTVPLDLSHISSYSIFPGKIIAVEGSNPTGSNLIVRNIFTSGYPDPSPAPSLQENLHLVVAAGPFTYSEGLDYQPLFDLMEHVAEIEPHVLILIGPFVPCNNPDIENPVIFDTFQELFQQVVENIMQYVKGLSRLLLSQKQDYFSDNWQMLELASSGLQLGYRLKKFVMDHFGLIFDDCISVKLLTNLVWNSCKCTQVVMIASHQDAHHDPVYPTPEFFLPKSMHRPNLHLMPNPCMLDVEGLIIGATSADIVRHLGSEEISLNMKGTDRLGRLGDHILSQSCFYPLYPPSKEINVDTLLWEKYAQIHRKPHILILPSDMRYFGKWTHDCFVMNPERLNKHTYARMIVKACSGDSWTEKKIDCEILKI